jgi:putative glutamine amidotransferase
LNKRVLIAYREADEVGRYEMAARAAGMTPALVQAGAAATLDGCAGLLLTGGGDVNPARYGAGAHPETEPPDDERDAAEAALIEEALRRDLPLFAICRGMQILNVHLGGTLVQHVDRIDRHRTDPWDKSEVAHAVTIEPGTLLAEIAGAESWLVNSRHHQAVDRLGAGLRVSARDEDDGTVEAMELPGRRFALAVQWHPEDQALAGDAAQVKLFRSFAAALT